MGPAYARPIAASRNSDTPEIEGFTDLEVIGYGGFSTVYSALQIKAQRRVALKVVHAAGIDARRFEREVLALGTLSGIPHIVQIHSVESTTEGTPVLVMPLMANSVATVVDSSGPVSPERVVRWANELAFAIDEAHRRGVAHRDIKPENVLISEFDEAYLADFGIALAGSLAIGTMTASSLSPAHAPPERFTGEPESHVVAGDVYSFASTMYHALAGRPPFGTTADGGIMGLSQRIAFEPAPPIPGVPESWQAALARGLAKHPMHRPASATELIRAVQPAAPPTSPPQSPPPSAPPPPPPRPPAPDAGTEPSEPTIVPGPQWYDTPESDRGRAAPRPSDPTLVRGVGAHRDRAAPGPATPPPGGSGASSATSPSSRPKGLRLSSGGYHDPEANRVGGTRWVARLLDNVVVVGLLGVVLVSQFGSLQYRWYGLPVWLFIAWTAVIPVIVEFLFLAAFGGSLGKLITRLRVVSESDRGSLSWWRAATRAAIWPGLWSIAGVYLVPIAGFVPAVVIAISILADRRLRGLPDRAAGTIVVHRSAAGDQNRSTPWALALAAFVVVATVGLVVYGVQRDDSTISAGTGARNGNGAHQCVQLADGRAACWGANDRGQLGNGTTIDSFRPTVVLGITSATGVTQSSGHTCAVIANSTVQCWGTNDHGQLGDGTTEDSPSPVDVPTITAVTGLAVGANHTCASVAAGTVSCWGANDHGQLGDGTTDDSSTPIAVPGISTAISVATGSDHSCAILQGGATQCWGSNAHGQLGDGTTDDSTTPVPVSGLTATGVVAGDGFTCAGADAKIRCWGANDHGQLGDGTTDDSSTPVEVAGISDAAFFNVGQAHGCAASIDGQVRCWGTNGHGHLGDGTTDDSSTPVRVDGVESKTAIMVSGDHTCALTTDKKLRCWGRNTDGELGNGSTDDSSTPTPVTDL